MSLMGGFLFMKSIREASLVPDGVFVFMQSDSCVFKRVPALTEVPV